MDRSKLDGAGGAADRGEPSQQVQVKTAVVKLGRGGPQEWPYYRLSPGQKREWDAVEDIIEALGKGKSLYSYGTIHAGRIRSKYWIGWAGTHSAVGMTAIPSRNHLHEMLCCNVHERFCFVVARRELSDDEAMEIWRHIDACLPHSALVERYGHVYCTAVEMPGHDCFEVFFRVTDSGAVTGVIQAVLTRSHPP